MPCVQVSTEFFFRQQPGNVGKGSAVYIFERTLHVLVNQVGDMYQSHWSEASEPHIFGNMVLLLVAFRVNVGQRVQHRLLIHILKNPHIVDLEVVCDSLPAV